MNIEPAPAICLAGIAAAVFLVAALVWSIAVPDQRIWPPKHSSPFLQVLVWTLTIAVFASAFALGVADWNRYGWPSILRWGIGLPLIVAGNWIVWQGVAKIGIEATSGTVAELKTDGLYAWSRNPQYVADMAILLGWAVLSASPWVLPVVAAGLLALAVAPFAEEPWLEESYGERYRQYRSSVRRYI